MAFGTSRLRCLKLRPQAFLRNGGTNCGHKLVGFPDACHADLEEIGGERGCPFFARVGSGIGVAESEKRKRAPRLRAVEFGGFFFAEGAEFAGATFDSCRGNAIGKRGGASAGTNGVRKNMEISKWAGLDEI